MDALPSLNCLYFWFDKSMDGRIEGVEEKFWIMHEKGLTKNGFEMFLIPALFTGAEIFSDKFLETVKGIPGITVHIGDKNHYFLFENGIEKKMEKLSDIMSLIGAKSVVLHASNFQRDRKKLRKLFTDCMPGTEIWIENDGFQSEWGYMPENILKIFEDFPDAGFVFDFAHVDEIPGRRCVTDYLGERNLFKKIVEVHCSFSNVSAGVDLYERAGYPGYRPYHGLFSLLGMKFNFQELDELKSIRRVIEGVVPREDREMKYLEKELNIFSSKDLDESKHRLSASF